MRRRRPPRWTPVSRGATGPTQRHHRGGGCLEVVHGPRAPHRAPSLPRAGPAGSPPRANWRARSSTRCAPWRSRSPLARRWPSHETPAGPDPHGHRPAPRPPRRPWPTATDGHPGRGSVPSRHGHHHDRHRRPRRGPRRPLDNVATSCAAAAPDGDCSSTRAAEPETLLSLVDGALDLVVTTHLHHDHVGALAAVVEATGARTDAAGRRTPTNCRCRPVADRARRRPSGSGTCGWRSSTCGATRPARSPCVLRDPTDPTTSTPATRCSPAGWATPSGTRRVHPAGRRRHRGPVRRPRRRHRRAPRPRRAATIGAERPHLAAWRARGW